VLVGRPSYPLRFFVLNLHQFALKGVLRYYLVDIGVIMIVILESVCHVRRVSSRRVFVEAQRGQSSASNNSSALTSVKRNWNVDILVE
jgi:hypothetical protein